MKEFELRAGTQGHGTTNYNEDAISELTGLYSDLDEEPSLTQQQFKEETDINEIMRRFGQGATLPDDYRAPMTGDFTEVVDFQTAMNAVRAAEESFMELPAEIRAKFGNDPQALITYLGNDKNREEAIELGLVQRPPEKTRDMVQAVDELKEALMKPPTTEKTA